MTTRVPKTWGTGQGRIHFPYLLIESDDPALALSDFTAFLQEGFNAAFCTGPGPRQPCPVLEGGRCTLIDEADVVLNRMRSDTGIPSAIRSSRPELPVVVVGTAADADLPPTASVRAQARTLRRAVHRGQTWAPSVGALGLSR